jgi:16S rRNA (cytosine1402-N4)-methyltransferase
MQLEHAASKAAALAHRVALHGLAGGDGDRDAGPARQPECPDSPGRSVMPHVPVMPAEVLDLLDPDRGGLFVDATLGLGGHAERILAASGDVRLIGIDRDAESLAVARQRLEPFGGRVTFVHDDHRNLPEILDRLGHGRSSSVAGIVADLGISSFQLGTPGRGFSFQVDEPLDMRMDRSMGPTAADLLAEADEEDLSRIFFEYGEERHARRIARAVRDRRLHRPILTTGDLASLVERVNPRRGARIHPATRVFQALRIAVNHELEALDRFVLDCVEALQARGRLVLLTFHSLEDRTVKTTLRTLSHQCSCPRSLPRCACGHPDRISLLNRKPLRPSAGELEANPRARSAKLRAAERL